MLHGAEHALRVRHHDGEAAVLGSEAGHAVRGTVRVQRVDLGRFAVVVYVAQGHQAAFGDRVRIEAGAEFHPAFAMGHGDRHLRSGHAGQEDGGRIHHLDHRHARLELFRTVAHEARPVTGAGDDVGELGEHLAAVAHAQAETVLAGEEGGELLEGARVEADGLGPASARAEHVAVGEAAAGDQTGEAVQGDAAFYDVAHVHVHRVEAGAGEGVRHLGLAIHALFAQYRHARAPAGRDHRRGDVVVDVVAQADRQAGVLGVEQAVEFLLGAFGVVAQALDVEAGFVPGALQIHAGLVQHGLAAEGEDDAVVVAQAADHMAVGAKAGFAQGHEHGIGVAMTHLNDRPQLLGEHGGEGVLAHHIEVDLHPAVRGEGHFRDGGEQAAVGAVVVGQQQAVLVEVLNGGEEGLQRIGILQVRGRIAHLAVDLREAGGAQAVLALAEVDQDQVGVPGIAAQLRGEHVAHVAHRREGTDDQRERGGHLVFLALFLPDGLHRQRVLADRDGDAELRAEFLTHRPDGVEQDGVLAGVARGGHPVGGQADVAEPADGRGGDVGDGLADRHAAGGRAVDEGDGSALAHRHGLAVVAVQRGGGDGHVGDRLLPWADHRIARDHAGDGAVADGDEETLVGHGRQAQHAVSGLRRVDAVEIEGWTVEGTMLDVAQHLRRLAEQHVHRQVDRGVVEMGVAHDQALLGGGGADHREGRTLTLTDALEQLQLLGRDGEHVTFLRFVAPDLHRRHAGLVVRHCAQFEAPAASGVVD